MWVDYLYFNYLTMLSTGFSTFTVYLVSIPHILPYFQLDSILHIWWRSVAFHNVVCGGYKSTEQWVCTGTAKWRANKWI